MQKNSPQLAQPDFFNNNEAQWMLDTFIEVNGASDNNWAWVGAQRADGSPTSGSTAWEYLGSNKPSAFGDNDVREREGEMHG